MVRGQLKDQGIFRIVYRIPCGKEGVQDGA
jgi:hypothetical protein